MKKSIPRLRTLTEMEVLLVRRTLEEIAYREGWCTDHEPLRFNDVGNAMPSADLIQKLREFKTQLRPMKERKR